MAELSPAAQAVVDAVHGIMPYTSIAEVLAIAAALRAAADQVVPERDCPDTEEWLGQSAWVQAESGARFRLLAIAAELEATTSDPLEPNDLSHLSEEEFRSLAPQGYHGL